MPFSASEVESSSYLRLLVLGGPKVGKTRTVIQSAPGPSYVINCDDQFSLKPAAVVRSDFVWDLVTGEDATIFQKMENAIGEARRGVKEGKYKTVVWDTLTYYAQRIELVLAGATDTGKGPDGRRYWPEYEKRLRNVVDRLFSLKAHIIVTAHYIDVKGAAIDNQLEKSGEGIVPLLGGKARATLPAMFQDVVFLEKKGGRRVFTCSSDGIWGPGCRNLEGVSQVDADIGVLWKAMTQKSETKKPETKNLEIETKKPKTESKSK
jgi:hypothetical protein